MHKKIRLAAAVLAAALLSACSSIPPEAPELSAQLGGRISAMQSAHRQLLADFFREKKNKIDDFIEREWVPLFAKELFSDKRIANVWEQVVKSGNASDRVRFITELGPPLQQKINSKRLELVQPLEQLEQTIASRLTGEYENMRSINSTLTAFLQSAAKVDENRRRYLEAVGVTDLQIESAINETDQVVSELLRGAQNAQDQVTKTENFRKKVTELISRLRRRE